MADWAFTAGDVAAMRQPIALVRRTLAAFDWFTLPPPYGRRTGAVRAVWVVANRSALHTVHIKGNTTVTTFVTGAVGFIGTALVSVSPRVALPLLP